jgi:hypothetical protein
MTNSVAIYTLIVGLIYGFAQAARGQQSGPVQPPPTGTISGSSFVVHTLGRADYLRLADNPRVDRQ